MAITHKTWYCWNNISVIYNSPTVLYFLHNSPIKYFKYIVTISRRFTVLELSFTFCIIVQKNIPVADWIKKLFQDKGFNCTTFIHFHNYTTKWLICTEWSLFHTNKYYEKMNSLKILWKMTCHQIQNIIILSCILSRINQFKQKI